MDLCYKNMSATWPKSTEVGSSSRSRPLDQVLVLVSARHRTWPPRSSIFIQRFPHCSGKCTKRRKMPSRKQWLGSQNTPNQMPTYSLCFEWLWMMTITWFDRIFFAGHMLPWKHTAHIWNYIVFLFDMISNKIFWIIGHDDVCKFGVLLALVIPWPWLLFSRRLESEVYKASL